MQRKILEFGLVSWENLMAKAYWIFPYRYEYAPCLFAWLISRILSANEQYFSLTTNQSTVLSVMAYQPSEQGIDIGMEVGTIELSNYRGLLWPQVPCMHATLLISPSLATVST